jgi:hypothetical protein
MKYGARSFNGLAPDDLHVVYEFFALQCHAQRRDGSNVETRMRFN